MSETLKSLPELIKELPPSDRKTARDFIEFLLLKHKAKSARTLRQDWAGSLREYKTQYTALELEKKALEWRSES